MLEEVELDADDVVFVRVVPTEESLLHGTAAEMFVHAPGRTQILQKTLVDVELDQGHMILESYQRIFSILQLFEDDVCELQFFQDFNFN